MDVLSQMQSCKNEHMKGKFQHALEIVERGFDLYRPKTVAFSFNGGKDSTALLHIIRAALVQTGVSDGSCKEIQNFMFYDMNDFTEIRSFSREMDVRYDMQMTYLEGSLQEELGKYIAKNSVAAVIIGTRRGDPNAPGQQYYCPSDKGWPSFMRINPVLDWTFQDIWTFLRLLNAPYCELYDLGYTSIGGVHNTAPNNALRKRDGSFAPAYLLADTRLERSGRSMLSRRQSDTAGLIRTVGVIAVGDELLAGKVEDINTTFLCKELKSLGWKVKKIVTIGDDVSVIAEEVAAMSASLELVITSGGVGPTLDDVTMAGVARAMETSLVRHPDLVQRLMDYFEDNVTEAHLKMAEVPSRAVEIVNVIQEDGSSSPFPVVKCANIYILPGVPHLLREKFQAVKQDLLSLEPLPPFYNIVLRLRTMDETQIAPILEDIASTAGADVEIGSYPVSHQSNEETGIILCLESKNTEFLEDAYKDLKTKLDQDAILSEARQVRAWLRSQDSSPSHKTGSAGTGLNDALDSENGEQVTSKLDSGP